MRGANHSTAAAEILKESSDADRVGEGHHCGIDLKSRG